MGQRHPVIRIVNLRVVSYRAFGLAGETAALVSPTHEASQLSYHGDVLAGNQELAAPTRYRGRLVEVSVYRLISRMEVRARLT